MAIRVAETGLAPGLLIAMPQLGDSNFSRSVVLMVEHGEQGSLGLIVNRPGQIPVAVILQGFGLEWQGDPRATVGFGGPVQVGTGWLVHEPVSGAPADAGSISVAPGIMLSVSTTMLRHVAFAPPPRLRFLMGYAGWAPGQLAAEFTAGSWLHAEATAAIVFAEPETMWEAALRSLGVTPSSLSPAAGVN